MTLDVSEGVRALLAEGPAPQFAAELMTFGQFVGSWDLEVRWYEAGAVTRRQRGEWHFFWVLEGRAVQDVWIVPPRDERSANPELYEYGTSIRIYDPALEAWRSTWVGPMHSVVAPLLARRVGDEIVLEGRRTDEGWPVQWIFSDISSDAFRWRNQASADGGASWQVTQDFTARRRAAH